MCGVTTLSRVQALKHLSKQHSKEAKESPDTYIMYCQEPDCETWVSNLFDHRCIIKLCRHVDFIVLLTAEDKHVLI